MSKMKSLETMLVILLVGMVSLSACSSIREGQLNKLTSEESQLIHLENLLI